MHNQALTEQCSKHGLIPHPAEALDFTGVFTLFILLCITPPQEFERLYQ
jgi:hypothetical protein